MTDILALVSSMRFSTDLWDPFRFLYSDGRFNFSYVLGAIKFSSLSLLALCFMLQVASNKCRALNGGRPFSLSFVVYAGLLGVVLAVPGLYEYGVRLLVSSGLLIQHSVMNQYMHFIEADIHFFMKSLVGGSKGLFSWMASLLEVFTPVGLLSALSAWTALALLYIIPLIQAFYISIFFLLGPLLIPWAVWEPSRRAAMFWLTQMLGAAFIGVISILAYSCLSAANIIANLRASDKHHVLCLFYSLVTIAVLCYSTYMAFSLFNAFRSSVYEGFKQGRKYITAGLF